MVLDGSEFVVSHDAITPSVSVFQQGSMEIIAMVRETGQPQAFCVCLTPGPSGTEPPPWPPPRPCWNKLEPLRERIG